MKMKNEHDKNKKQVRKEQNNDKEKLRDISNEKTCQRFSSRNKQIIQ